MEEDVDIYSSGHSLFRSIFKCMYEALSCGGKESTEGITQVCQKLLLSTATNSRHRDQQTDHFFKYMRHFCYHMRESEQYNQREQDLMLHRQVKVRKGKEQSHLYALLLLHSVLLQITRGESTLQSGVRLICMKHPRFTKQFTFATSITLSTTKTKQEWLPLSSLVGLKSLIFVTMFFVTSKQSSK